MRRLTSYRDFDWTLLTLVALLSLISVIEIHSATMHTKFHGFGSKQIGFLAIGLVLMFAISAIDYHKLVEISPWAYGDRMKLSNLAVILAFVIGAQLAGVIGALIALPIAAIYPAIERIWLRQQVGEETVREHQAIEGE